MNQVKIKPGTLSTIREMNRQRMFWGLALNDNVVSLTLTKCDGIFFLCSDLDPMTIKYILSSKDTFTQFVESKIPQ